MISSSTLTLAPPSGALSRANASHALHFDKLKFDNYLLRFIIVFKKFINSFLLTIVAIITNKEYIIFPINGWVLNFVVKEALMQKKIIANANIIQFEFFILFIYK